MSFSRGVYRGLIAGFAALAFGVNLAPAVRADDDNNGPAPQHVKTLRERILEVQAGKGIIDKANNREQTFTGPALSDREKAVQALNRLAFGPKPGQVDIVVDVGWEAWAREQLDPSRIDDSACEALVAARFPWVGKSMNDMEEEFGNEKGVKKKRREDENSIRVLLPQLVLTRAINSKRQFKEVMCDFWRQHFCVDQPELKDNKSRTWTAPDYEENVIRKYAFGDFKDMLFASARHPAMLEYLDNKLSRKNEWNENYAREVMELHTLGADRGYGNRDVQELSKILTGWQYDDNYNFRFNAAEQQPGPKYWLNYTVPEGEKGGEEALYTLAMHPNTAQFISEKLCRYLVNDNPSPELVKKVATVFRESKGNLPKVYAAIIFSPDFMSRENYRSKFKTPFFFTVSALRATAPKIDSLAEINKRIARMGEPIYNCPDPTGYRDVAESWMDAGVLTTRWQLSWDLLRGSVAGVTVDDTFMNRYKSVKPEEVEPKMLEDLIGGEVGDRELAALKETANQSDWSRMASIVLGSPSFQQR